MPKAVQTRQRRLGTIRRALQWAVEEGWLPASPAARMRTPRGPKPPPPQMPTFAEVQTLLTTIGSQGRYRRRDQAAFSLCYSAALRESELCSLRIGDVHLDLRTVKVVGKGRKVRAVKFDEPTQRALRVYLSTRPDATDPTRPLILSARGSAWSPVGMRHRFRYHVTRLDLPFRVWVHGLRHARLTHLYQATRDLRFVQDFAGHSSPATTAIYTHVDVEDTYDRAESHLANGQPT